MNNNNPLNLKTTIGKGYLSQEPYFDSMNGRAINVSPGIEEAVSFFGGSAGKILLGTGNIIKDTIISQTTGHLSKGFYERLKDLFDSDEDKNEY